MTQVASRTTEEATVSFQEPTATDNSGTVVLVSRSHAPGSIFHIGTTEVTYIFRDLNGNTGSCTFTVTVLRGMCIFIALIVII